MVGVAITVTEAADRLGVAQQRVRSLIADGEILATRHGRSWMVDPESVNAYARRRRPTAGRALSPAIAWAALLSDFGTRVDDRVVSAFGLRRSEKARIEQLAERPPEAWRWLARRRAHTRHFDTRGAYLDRVLATSGLTRTGLSAADRHDIGLAVHEPVVDVYGNAETIDALVTQLRLRPAASGNLTLRAVADLPAGLADYVLNRQIMPVSVVAVDLMDSPEPRTAKAGLEIVQGLVHG